MNDTQTNLLDMRPFKDKGWQVLQFATVPTGGVVLCGNRDGGADFSRFVTAWFNHETLAYEQWEMGHYFFAEYDGLAAAKADYAERVERGY